MATDEKERVAKLETRAREAENALQQLNGYVELLKEKSNSSQQLPTGSIDLGELLPTFWKSKSDQKCLSTEAKKLEAENEELRREVFRLKQQLILEEIRNGGTVVYTIIV